MGLIVCDFELSDCNGFFILSVIFNKLGVIHMESLAMEPEAVLWYSIRMRPAYAAAKYWFLSTEGRKMDKPDIPDKIRQRLYPVVLDLFSNHDFHQVNIRDISRRSGLSTSTIYRYFPSKEAMVFTILDEKISEIAKKIRSHLRGLESSREMIRKSFWMTFNFYDENPELAVTAFITVPMRNWMQTDAYRAEDTYEIIAYIVRKGQEQGEIDPALTISQAMDLYYMFCYRQIHRWYYNGRKWKLTEALPGFFDLFWKAVRA